MKFHHVGCLVADLASALKSLAVLATGPPQKPVRVVDQRVTVCLMPLGNETFLELVCPEPEAQGLQELLKSDTNFYHMAFTVPDLEAKVAELQSGNYVMLTVFSSELFSGALCAFLKSPEGILVELIEEK